MQEFRVGIVTKRGTVICPQFVCAEDEFQALLKYREQELTLGNDITCRTAKVLPDGMTMYYTHDPVENFPQGLQQRLGTAIRTVEAKGFVAAEEFEQINYCLSRTINYHQTLANIIEIPYQNAEKTIKEFKARIDRREVECERFWH